jgi:transposase
MDNAPRAQAEQDPTSRFRESKTDRDRSLDAIHLLELHAGSAAPGREQEWLASIHGALEILRGALTEQADNSLGADSLLSTIGTEQPHMCPKIDQLRRRYQAVSQQIDELNAELRAVAEPEAIDIADIRQTLDAIATELRYQRARESDLVYEAYSLDLGEGD